MSREPKREKGYNEGPPVISRETEMAAMVAMTGLLSGSPPPDGALAVSRLVGQAWDIGFAFVAEGEARAKGLEDAELAELERATAPEDG